MTVYSVKAEFEPALVEFGRVLARASIFFLRELGGIVDVTGLREGDEEHDYFLEVPAEQLDAVRPRVAELLHSVQEQFGVEISVATRAAPA